MKTVCIVCPKCGNVFYYKNIIWWILYTPFHWFGKRLTKCPKCGKKKYMRREKNGL